MSWTPPTMFPAQDWSAIDHQLAIPSDQELQIVAATIDGHHKTDRRVSKDAAHPRLIGLRGERQVARELGLPMDLRILPKGTRRTNFVLADGTPVDVVTRTVPRNGQAPELILRTTERELVQDRAMVLVIWFDEAHEPWIPGWAWESELRQSRVISFVPGVTNWAMTIDQLHAFDRLLARNLATA